MKIICFGDSNTWGYDPRGYFGGRYDHPWPELVGDMLGCTVINQGENGREIPHGPIRVSADTDLLIVMLGTNDLLQGAGTETVCRRMEAFLSGMEPGRILLMAPPPLRLGSWVCQDLVDAAASLSVRYRELAARLGIRFCDAGQWHLPMAYDGVHMTEEDQRAFAEGVYKELMEL